MSKEIKLNSEGERCLTHCPGCESKEDIEERRIADMVKETNVQIGLCMNCMSKMLNRIPLPFQEVVNEIIKEKNKGSNI